MGKISSGIEGLDNLMSGGLPTERAYLISGEPGTGKTLFCLQFLLDGLRKGERCTYISIDERPDHILKDIQELGWDIQYYLDSGAFQILDISSYFESTHLDSSDPVNIDSIIDKILNQVATFGSTRLAIDPVAPLVLAESQGSDVIEYVRRLIFKVEALSNCTTFLTSYVPVGSDKYSHHGVEEFAASGIILLSIKKMEHKYVRSIRLRKMRGTRIDLTEFSFEILPQRGLVLRQPI